MKKLPGKSINTMALPFKGAALHVFHVIFQIDGLPRMVLDLEMLGRRSGGNRSLFLLDRVEAKLNEKPIISMNYTKRGMAHKSK